MRKAEMLPVTTTTAEVVEVIERPASAPQPVPPNPLVVMHSLLRGRYVLAIVLALAGASIGGFAGYYAMKPVYRSTGLIRVKPTLPIILEQNDVNAPMARFDGYVASQVQLIKSRRVVDLAMLDPNWKKFGRGISDRSVADFLDSLDVASPKGSELIQVAFVDQDPGAAAAAVTAVIKAYLEFSRNSETEEGVPRMTVLDNIRKSQELELELKNNAMHKIAAEFGNEQALQRMIDSTMNDIERLKAELHQVQRTLRQLALSTNDTAPATAPLVLDPQMRGLLREKNRIVQSITQLGLTYGSEHPKMVEARGSLMSIEDEIRDYEEALRAVGNAGGVHRLASPDQLANAEKELQSLLEQAHQNKLDLSRRQTQLEQLKQEVVDCRKNLERTQDRIKSLEVEEKHVGGRILMVSEGDRPVGPHKDRRRAVAAVGAFGMAGLAVGAVMLVGLADRRLRRIADAQSHLKSGSKLLGLVPELEQSTLDFGSATITAHCVHRIRALLQMRRQAQEHPTFVLTSPSAGDGKTTLTIALGMSFAASGARTLLVDLDLIGGGLTSRINRPLHRKIGQILLREGRITAQQLREALGAARQTGQRVGEALVNSGDVTQEQLAEALMTQLGTAVGISEVLVGESLEDCVTSTGMANLYVLPLGTAGAEQVGKLSPELIRRILSEAQAKYDAILIDSGPVLGSLEASMAGSCATGVIMVISRGGNRSLAHRAVASVLDTGGHLEGVVFNRADPDDVETSSYSSYASRASRSIRAGGSSVPKLQQPAERTMTPTDSGKHR